MKFIKLTDTVTVNINNINFVHYYVYDDNNIRLI